MSERTVYSGLVAAVVAETPFCPVCGEDTLRVGTDVQEIAAVASALDTHGQKYLRRLFTQREVDTVTGGRGRSSDELPLSGAASLAGRYAVKEAVIKALRPIHTGVPWAEIEVVRQPEGWCTLALHGSAKRLATVSGLSSWIISFAHDEGVAVATVIARHECVMAFGPEARSVGD